MALDRRRLLSVAGASAGLLLRPRLGFAQAVSAEDCFTEVTEGKLRGIESGGVEIYRGIPYASAVSGGGRFRAAGPVQPWTGVRNATKLGPPAIQPPHATYGFDEPLPAEDCLVLNIWRPTGGAGGKPVMVYSHGGAFVTGSGGSVLQDGSHLAKENDVVVVATNHRLGVMGYLYLDHLAGTEYAGSGNRGVQDIAVALEWVAHNIAAFGGDPANVTIFGESGGGLKTSCLYAMPLAAPYFHKASIESGPGVRIMSTETAIATTDLLLTDLGLDRTSWRKLLDIPAAQLLASQMRIGGNPNLPSQGFNGPINLAAGQPGTFGPVVDGHVIPRHPFDPDAPEISRDKPLIVGGNKDEQMFFSLIAGDQEAWRLDEQTLLTRVKRHVGEDANRMIDTYRTDRPDATPSDLFFAIQSDMFSIQGSTVIAERKARQGGAPVYRFVFAFESGATIPGVREKMGAMHSLDIVFKFNNMDTKIMNLPNPVAGTRPDRFAAGTAMSRMWANFARTGRPSAPEQPAWPAYDLETRATMFIDAKCHVENDPHRAERLFWEERRSPMSLH